MEVISLSLSARGLGIVHVTINVRFNGIGLKVNVISILSQGYKIDLLCFLYYERTINNRCTCGIGNAATRRKGQSRTGSS